MRFFFSLSRFFLLLFNNIQQIFENKSRFEFINYEKFAWKPG